MRAVRIVSLVPSSTETLLALGADVVACTRFCEQPQLPQVGGTKNPDIDAITALAPDVVVMDVEENTRQHAEALRSRGVEVYATRVLTVEDAISAVHQLASVAGVPDVPGSALAVPPPRPLWARALVPIWRRPWMLLGPGTYGASLLARLGIDVVSPTGSAYEQVDLDHLGGLGAELVLVPSEPYPFREPHVAELGRACPGATVGDVDGKDLFWWGTRTPAAIERLGAALPRLRPEAR